MFWLGLEGRKRIGKLEEEIQELRRLFRELEIEMVGNIDKLSGIAKRMQGRRGGRPPKDGEGAPEEGQAQEGEPASPTGTPSWFSRHIE